MIQHVYERGVESGAQQVIIATDSEQIRKAAEGFGAQVVMTSTKHPSGTDRIAEAAEHLALANDQIIVNLQGDEPLMPPQLIHQVADDLNNHAGIPMTTLGVRIQTVQELFDPHVVKLVTDKNGVALFFSRAPIPWDREAFSLSQYNLPADHAHYRHIGMYAYRHGFLKEFVKWQSAPIEQLEALEQLRVLWNGYKIYVSEAQVRPDPGVDTPQDLEVALSMMAAKKQAGLL